MPPYQDCATDELPSRRIGFLSAFTGTWHTQKHEYIAPCPKLVVKINSTVKCLQTRATSELQGCSLAGATADSCGVLWKWWLCVSQIQSCACDIIRCLTCWVCLKPRFECLTVDCSIWREMILIRKGCFGIAAEFAVPPEGAC